MVVLVDLDEEGWESSLSPRPLHDRRQDTEGTLHVKLQGHPGLAPSAAVSRERDATPVAEANANAYGNSNGFAAALACYPVVTEIASSLDLNDLHALSRVCHRFRALLLPFRTQLIHGTLRCVNDEDRRPTTASAAYPALSSVDEHGGPDHFPAWVADMSAHELNWDTSSYISHMTAGRVGPCARDLVGPCQRCGRTVCRNCTIKRPLPARLPGRHRRLCTACRDAPLDALTGADALAIAGSGPLPSSNGADRHDENAPATLENNDDANHPARNYAFTAPAFVRGPCMCPDVTYLCQACGHDVQGADTTYRRIWLWRTRYSQNGLGTGIGVGYEGVKCGRGDVCLAAQEIEVERDCTTAELDAASAAQHGEACSPNGPNSGSISSAPTTGSLQSSDVAEFELSSDLEASGLSDEVSHKAGYLRQEIEGIGGVVRGKIKERVLVGATVPEYEDEREHASYLNREILGSCRSWCGWCLRVIPAQRGDGVDDECKF